MNGWLGPWELLLIIIIALILFGPKKIPEIARMLGQAVAEFKKASQAVYEVKDEIESTKKEIESTFKLESSPRKGKAEETKAAQQIKEVKYEEKILELAKKLNIQTENKSLDEILSEIEAKLGEIKTSKENVSKDETT